MKKYYPLTLIVLLSAMLSSCELVGDIFEAGVWVGVIIVVVVVAVIIWIISRLFGGRS